MLKSNYLKILSFSLIFILAFSCPSVKAFASTQNTADAYKAVSVYVKVPFSCYPGQEVMVVNLIINSRPTYSYDDGQYRGTLTLNGYTWNSDTQPQPGHATSGPCYYNLEIFYFGTATLYQ